MPITFRCSDCTQKLRIEDDFAGKRVACVRCGSKQRVPQVSSPEFSQPAAAPREPAPPTPPPPERQPREQKSTRRPAARREPLKQESPRHAPIWFEPAPPEANEPPVEPEPPQPEPFLSEPAVVEPAVVEPGVEEPGVEEPAVSEPALLKPTGLTQMTPEATRSEAIRPERTVPVSRGRRVAAARRESPLVPPFKKLDVEELIDMTAMVDIVFFLLIFFLVTSMHALDSTIPMPAPDPKKGAASEPRSVAAIDADDSYVVVRIDRNDKISVEGSEVRSDRDLLFKLRDLRLGSAHPEKLLVVGHGDATHGTVVMVLDAGRELGMDQVKLTVQDEAE